MKKTYKITIIALMAALCYVGFSFLQIKIPTPAGYTSFHMGNVFCVLAALMLDGVSGGLAGAIGMSIGDLFDPAYVLTTPKTFILKFFIGFISGYVAHKVLHIEEKRGKDLFMAALISSSCGMLFNMIGEPLISYLYYDLLLNNASKAQSYLAIAKWITTSVNSIVAIIVSTLLYVPLSTRISFINKK